MFLVAGAVCGEVRAWTFDRFDDTEDWSGSANRILPVSQAFSGEYGVLTGAAPGEGIQLRYEGRTALPPRFTRWSQLKFRARLAGADGTPAPYTDSAEAVTFQSAGSGPVQAEPIARRQVADGWVQAVYDISSAGTNDLSFLEIHLPGFPDCRFELDEVHLLAEGGYKVGFVPRRDFDVPVLAPFSYQNSDLHKLDWFLEYDDSDWSAEHVNQRYILDRFSNPPMRLNLGPTLFQTEENGTKTLTPDFIYFDRAMSFGSYYPVKAETITLRKAGNSAVGPLTPDEVRWLKAATISRAQERLFDISGAAWQVIARLAQWRNRPWEITGVTDDLDGYSMEVDKSLGSDLVQAYESGNWDSFRNPDMTLDDFLAAQILDRQSWLEITDFARSAGKTIHLHFPLNALQDPVAAYDVLTPSVQTILWLEDHDALPDSITPMYYPDRGFESARMERFPETVLVDGKARPANTVSGMCYWLLVHRDGLHGDLDLTVEDESGAWRSEGVWSGNPSHPVQMQEIVSPGPGEVAEVRFRLRNRSGWMHYTAALRAERSLSGWNAEFRAADGSAEYTDGFFSRRGFVLNGNNRLNPAGESGDFFEFVLFISKTDPAAPPFDLTVRAFSHTGSITGAGDSIRIVSDATLDSDGDGYTDREELIAGTDPYRASDFFRGRIAVMPSDGRPAPVVHVHGRENRLYRLLQTECLRSGIWQITDEAPGAGGLLTFSNRLNSSAGFFRVEVTVDFSE